MMALTTFARFATARASSSSTRPRGRVADVAWPTMTRVNVNAVLATALYLLFGSSAIAGEVCRAYGGTVFSLSYSGYKYSNSLQQKDINAELKVNGITSEMRRKLTPAVKTVKSAVRSTPFRKATVVGMAIGGSLVLFGGWLEDRYYCLLTAATPTKMEE